MSITRMIRSVELASSCRPLEVSRSSENRPVDNFEEWIILREVVSMMLMKPLDVPEMMWLPCTEKMAEVVDCLVDDFSLSGSDGSLCLMGISSLISTRKGWSSKRETQNMYGLYG